MKFDELDARMRACEDALDVRLPGEGWVVARLDGRGFSKLTAGHSFEKPFDERFRDLMIQAARHVTGRFGAVFATTHSDEMSLLLRPHEAGWPFEGRARKYLSLLASEASAGFSLALKSPAAFDCRLVALPDDEDVIDYFRWRAADSERNALSAHAYWMLRLQGLGGSEASRILDALSPAAKIDLLAQNGTAYAQVPAWHKRGVGLIWASGEVTGQDPRTGAEAHATRRRLRADVELPQRAELATLIAGILKQTRGATP